MWHVSVACSGRIVYIYFVKIRSKHARSSTNAGQLVGYNPQYVIHCAFVLMLLFTHYSLREEEEMD